MITNLFACSSRGSKTESLLDVLSDGHGAEDVEEDEAAVSHVITQQVPVTQTLYQPIRSQYCFVPTNQK